MSYTNFCSCAFGAIGHFRVPKFVIEVMEGGRLRTRPKPPPPPPPGKPNGTVVWHSDGPTPSHQGLGCFMV